MIYHSPLTKITTGLLKELKACSTAIFLQVFPSGEAPLTVQSLRKMMAVHHKGIDFSYGVMHVYWLLDKLATEPLRQEMAFEYGPLDYNDPAIHSFLARWFKRIKQDIRGHWGYNIEYGEIEYLYEPKPTTRKVYLPLEPLEPGDYWDATVQVDESGAVHVTMEDPNNLW